MLLRQWRASAARELATGQQWAIKIMDLPKPGVVLDNPDNANSWQDIMSEIEVLSNLHHPNIISLKEYYFQNNSVYVVTELLEGARLLSTSRPSQGAH